MLAVCLASVVKYAKLVIYRMQVEDKGKGEDKGGVGGQGRGQRPFQK